MPRILLRSLTFASLAAAAYGQPTSVTVVQTTNTGVAICYTAEDAVTSYTVEVSLLSDFSVLVHDVDPALFANADQDLDRPDTTTNGNDRCVQVGHTGHFFEALDGSRRDRVLQAYTTYYARVGGVAISGTTFTTDNIPLSIVGTQALDVAAPLRNVQPTTNPNYQSEFRDPWTGALVKVINDFSNAWAYIWTGSGGSTFGLVETTDSWAASSGTLTDAVASNDGIYAEADNAGDILFLGLYDIDYNKLKINGNFSNLISWINVIVNGDCTGAGCGSGIDAEICLTYDAASCSSPWKTFTMTTTETAVTVCHPEEATPACSTTQDPGDWWDPAAIPLTDWNASPYKLYNGTGCTAGTNPVCFVEQAGCDRRRVGEQLRWSYGNGGVIGQVASLSCGSTPPYVELVSHVNADLNGTAGTPFAETAGVSRNPRFGFLVRKKNTVANATLRIDNAAFVQANYANTAQINQGAAGYITACQPYGVTTAGGRTLCAGNGLWSVLNTGSELDFKYLGYGYFSGLPYGENVLLQAPEYPWSQTEAGVLYITARSTITTSPVSGDLAYLLYKIELNTPDIACGDAGSGCTLPTFPNREGSPDVTVTLLTPCLAPCTSASDDYTLAGQIMRLVPDYDLARFGIPGIAGVQGNTILMDTREAAQDSFGQHFAFDLGNGGLPGSTFVGDHGNTQQMFSHYRPYDEAASRWAGFHTHQTPLGLTSHVVLEMAAGYHTSHSVTATAGLTACTIGVDCDTCPSVTVGGHDYTGQKRCSTLDVTSAWMTGVWETEPATFEAGDPVNTHCPDCSTLYHWIMKLAVGDHLYDTNGTGISSDDEYVQLVQRNSNTEWVIARACGHDTDGYWATQTHSSSATWDTYGWTGGQDCTTTLPGYSALAHSWDYINDTDGTATALNPFENHGFAVPTYRMDGGYTGQAGDDFTMWSDVEAITPTQTPAVPNNFAGVDIACSAPNCVESHPGGANYDAPVANDRSWFYDSHPYLFADDGITITNVSGSLYYAVNTTYPHKPKLAPMMAWQGNQPFQRVSSIGDTSADYGKWCVAEVNDACFTGSTAGRMYLNINFDAASTQCVALAGYGGQQDVCVGNFVTKSAATAAQQRVPPDNTTVLTNNFYRTITHDDTYRGGATSNTKSYPDGKFLFYSSWQMARNQTSGYAPNAYVVLPPFPSDDSVDRTTFIPRTITISSVPVGTTKVRLKFGYDENFRPNDNSDEAGYAVSTTVNESEPFLWESELTSSDGVPCTTSCTVQIPSIEGRVLRYQAVYINDAGVSTGNGPVSFSIGSLPVEIDTNLQVGGPAAIGGGVTIP